MTADLVDRDAACGDEAAVHAGDPAARTTDCERSAHVRAHEHDAGRCDTDRDGDLDDDE